jgi:phage terminase large subunit-like protein
MMAASAQRLIAAGLPMEEFVQSMPNLTAASQNLYELIQSGGLVVYPDPDMRLSVSRAIASEGSRGWKIDKAKQAHKIDVVIALGMAAYAAVQSQGEAPPLLPYDQWAGDGGADDWFCFQRSLYFARETGGMFWG